MIVRRDETRYVVPNTISFENIFLKTGIASNAVTGRLNKYLVDSFAVFDFSCYWGVLQFDHIHIMRNEKEFEILLWPGSCFNVLRRT